MSQILHIFRKDVRRHRIEILAALIALGVYAWHEPRLWSATTGGELENFIGTVMLAILWAAWLFQIVHVVHGENLVGDNQFWVTRPYEWPKLIAAKILFVIAVVNLPLFVVQISFLHHAALAIFPNVPGLLFMQLFISLAIFLPVAMIATVTRNFGHVVLVALALVLYSVGIVDLYFAMPNANMTVWGHMPGPLVIALVLGVCVFVIVWQYARRSPWQARVVIAALLLAILLVIVTTPYRLLVAKTYPLPAAKQLPLAQFTVHARAAAPPNYGELPPEVTNVFLSLPLLISGVDGNVVVRGILVEIEGQDGSKVSSHWQPEFTRLSPESREWQEGFALKRQIFDKYREMPVNLHVSLALASYRDKNERRVVASTETFVIPDVGECWFAKPDSRELQCRSTFRKPLFVATTDADPTRCGWHVSANHGDVAYAVGQRSYQQDALPIPDDLLDPIENFGIAFSVRYANEPLLYPWGICPGTPLTFRTPTAYANSRAEFDVHGVRLSDYLPPK